MKLHAFVPLLSATFILLFQGCNQEKGLFELFSGTLPRFEIEDEDGSRYTDPQSLFFTLKGDVVELEGEVYSIQQSSENEEQISYTTTIPIHSELTVSALTYLKTEKKLLLRFTETEKELSLEKFSDLMERKAKEFAEVELKTDLSHLSDNQREMIGLLFQVADIMDDIYWAQVFPDRDAALASMVDEHVARFFQINYGPWERLNGNLPFLPGYGPKPRGSGYYPADMSKEEFESLDDPEKSSLYTLITRDPDGSLQVVPYHEAYAGQLKQASELLKQAADLAEDKGFKKYLKLRADALLTDDYYPSDMAWMDMKENDIDFVVGPIENYEDALYNYKAAHESFILIKDKSWSEKLAYISSVLPQMQKSLPVPEVYKQEVPGSQSDLGAYDVIYYAGDCNAGSKTIAINLPNDERVQAGKGSRKLQLKNAIRYKFEEILLPISNVLIAEEQREHVTFDAFFENVMFHEVAHGLGLNQTIHGSGTVRSALKEQYSALEEGKADILSLFLITKMYEEGMLGERDLMDTYVTFMASIFRSIRFGVASSHGKANMIRFYYFQEMGAFARDLNGTYSINFEAMQQAMYELTNLILTTQGDGDYELAKRLVEEKGFIREELQSDLERLELLHIPVDIVFKQGPGVVGLQ
ncbi:MAG: Zn-dependent hydrolase [Bacteroidales bacterium]|nr:Zn-dependent hydrolase [Bacteroidales bacterium]